MTCFNAPKQCYGGVLGGGGGGGGVVEVPVGWGGCVEMVMTC